MFSALIIFTGCASTEDIGKIQYDINVLRSDIKKLKKNSRNLQSQLPGQREKFDKSIKTLKGNQDATTKSISDLFIEIETLRSDVQAMTGRFEEIQHQSERNTTEIQETKEMLLARLHELELSVSNLKEKISSLSEAEKKRLEREENQRLAREAEARAKEEEARAKEAALKAKKEAEEKALREASSKVLMKDRYMSAYQMFKEGKTTESRTVFRSLLKDFPENEYSDNARFWIGESYYKDNNYEEAILAYEELFRKNPDSDKIPGAMLKQGLAFYALKDKKTGKIILERLINKYPDSEQATSAKKKMRKIVTPEKNN